MRLTLSESLSYLRYPKRNLEYYELYTGSPARLYPEITRGDPRSIPLRLCLEGGFWRLCP